MKKIILLIVLCLFCFGMSNQSTFSKTTYKIQSNGSIKPSKVPFGTPKKPSKAAKLNLTENSDEKESLSQDEKNSSSKNVKKTKSKKSSGSKKTVSSKVRMYNKVNEIGEKMLESSNIAQDVAFSLSSSGVENAYTNKYNQITLNRGIINFAESDDEIAAIIGHELGHVLNYDVRKSIRSHNLRKILAANASTALDAGLVVTSELVARKKARNREYNADIAGVDMMVNAGYNPLAMISILNKITDHYNDVAATHPTGRKRLLAIYNYIETYYPDYLAEGYPTVSYKNALRIIGKN